MYFWSTEAGDYGSFNVYAICPVIWTVCKIICLDVTIWFVISPLHTIRRCSQRMTKLLVREKNWVSQNLTKRDLHAIRHRPQLSRMCVATENILEYDKKSYLCLSKDCLLRRRHFAKVFYYSQIMTNQYLHTTCVLHEFHQFVLFHRCLRIMCSRL